MDCQDLEFSPEQSQKRIDRALQVLPVQVLKKILVFSLYLLGVKRTAISSLMEMPEESVKTGISKVMKYGLSGFRDRRQFEKISAAQVSTPLEEIQPSVLIEDKFCTISFGSMGQKLKILRKHRVHLRTVLLSLLDAGLLSIQSVSSALGITAAHCRELSEKLMQKGVADVLIDKRKGQMRDFRFGPSAKAELIQHFAARAVTGHPVSSQALAELINDSMEAALPISARTVRWHMNKLGLTEIKQTLPELVNTLKKKF
jgi:hypothetical protein